MQLKDLRGAKVRWEDLSGVRNTTAFRERDRCLAYNATLSIFKELS